MKNPGDVRQLVAVHRRRGDKLQRLRVVGIAAAAAISVFVVAVAVDHFLRLPMSGRAAAALLVLGTWTWSGRWGWKRLTQTRPSEDEIVLAIERRVPGGLANRLINSLQIGREHAATSTDALLRENWGELEGQPLPGPVAPLPAALAGAAACLATFVLAAGVLWQPAQFRTAASRILLPFAAIDPLYRTVLSVEPGDVEAAGDVPIRVRIRGERPEQLTVLFESSDNRSEFAVPVPQGSDSVTATIPNVVRSLSYAVRGGDYLSPFYRVEVPAAPQLASVRATLHFPPYARLEPRIVETTGALEALEGTRAEARFVLNHPVESATLVLRERSAEGRPAPAERRVTLTKKSETEFEGVIEFADVSEYRLETQLETRTPAPTAWHPLRLLPDEPPRIELSGVPASSELPADSPVPLGVTVVDDFGLTGYGIFLRQPANAGGAGALRTAQAPGEKRSPLPADAPVEANGEWRPLAQWSAEGERKLTESTEFLAESLGLVEGDRLELAARAADTFPGREGEWTSGNILSVIVAGEGTQLQLQYEQILRSEAEIAALIVSVRGLHRESDTRIRKLDSGAITDDNSAAAVKEVVGWAAERSREQSQLRETAARVAREMVPAAGNLRLSLGMLADTEMIRTVRAFDSVPTRDDARGRRTALTDARATQQRAVASLEQIYEQYVRFRHDWELAHMIPYLRMLADRQAALRDQSQQRADAGETVPVAQCNAAVRRQNRISELCAVASAAFLGMAERTAEVEEMLAEAFAATAEALTAEDLKQKMAAAAEAMMAADWAAAAKEQSAAAERLAEMLTKLQEAQSSAARRLIAALEERSESDLAAQAALEKLKAGSGEDLLDEPEGLKLTDLIHAADVVQNRNAGKREDPKPNNYLFPDSAIGMLQQPDTGKRQQFEILKLATSPGTTPSFPRQSDRQGNRVRPHIQEEFEDLVGELLEEEDEMKANYETFNLNAAFNINEPGEIGKQAGDLNSTAAAAATGNQKPPTTNVGGASRVGRQGARAFGAAVGKESINRRGRDKVQEGQERAPDQAGSVKETKSEDPQEDTSTGIGGRKVESEDAKFGLNDAGEFTEDMIGRMEKPKEKFSIVERQGKGIDAKVAEAMRDLTSKQEQTLERLKSIRKELKNLYLPTEHLDELIQQMQANLQSLSERPTSDIYQLQQKTLDEIRGALQVFHQAHSGFQASLPREQSVRGRVLDDPSRAAPPGYEEAVRLYYEKLTTR